MFNVKRPYASANIILHSSKETPREWCNIKEMKLYAYSPIYGWFSSLIVKDFTW